jgi:type I restriction enzyme S subunit
MEKKLPKGWELKSFNKVFDIQGGTQPPKSQFISEPKQGYIRLLQIRDFGNKPVPTYIPDTGKWNTCDIDDILIARYGASIGRIVTGQKGAYNVALAKVKIPTDLDKRYALWLLKSHLFQNFITGFQRTAQSGFNKNDLNEIYLPIAPLTEQERIAAKLDTLFAHLETAKAGLEKIPVLLKQFRQAVLTQAVTGKLTEEFDYQEVLNEINIEKQKYWEIEIKNKNLKKLPIVKNKLSKDSISKLESILFKKYDIGSFDEISSPKPSALKAGPFGSSLKKEFYVADGYKVYGQEQVIKNDPFYGDYYINEERFNLLKSCEVNSNDILISLVGTIGKVLIIPEKFEKGIINPRLVKLSLHEKINPHFIKYYLQSEFVINLLKDKSHGGTMDVLNLGILRELPIPLPSIKEQNEIVYRVEALFAKADAIEEKYKQLKEKIENLPQAVLAKAFRGEA